MTVWVDADSCPRRVRDIVAKGAVTRGFPVVYVANRAIPVTVPVPENGDGAPTDRDSGPVSSVSATLERIPVTVAWRNGPALGVVAGDGDRGMTADDVILDLAVESDLVITRDLPLAERAVERGVWAMNDRGTIWTKDTVRERRSVRDAALYLRSTGVAEESGPRSFSSREVRQFAGAFDSFLQRHLS